MRYQVAGYYRISNEDREDAESGSITGQRGLIEAYLKNSRELSKASYIEFYDDGYSGTNFDRPGFQQMMKRVQRGEINCIIVKDLSRFGRSYIEASRYIEEVFPYLGVRFIAINDGYDNKTHTGAAPGLEIPFQNLICALYSRDISQKVIAAKRAKMKQGESIAAYAIYGYKKAAHNRNQLEIDEQAACYVRRMFEMSCDGSTPREIALALNRDGVATPAGYKKTVLKTKRAWNSLHDKNIWTAAAVRRILLDRRYIGDYVGGRWKTDEMGSRTAVKTNCDEWIVVAGAMPAIIESRIFEKSCEQITARTAGGKRGQETILSRMVFCGHCGYTMGRRDSKSHAYFCRTRTYTDEFGCQDIHIEENTIVQSALAVIRVHAQLACDAEKIWMSATNEMRARVEMCKKGQLDCTERAKQLTQSKLALYETYRTQKWPRERYAQEREKLEQEIAAQEEFLRCRGLELQQLQNQLTQSEHTRFLADFSRHACIKELERRLAQNLIERIDVYDAQHICITLKYPDALKNENQPPKQRQTTDTE